MNTLCKTAIIPTGEAKMADGRSRTRAQRKPITLPKTY